MNALRLGAPRPKTVAEKMGVRPGVRAHHYHVPTDVLLLMRLPNLDLSDTLHGQFEHIHAFMRTKHQMKSDLPVLHDCLAPNGSLWLSWPKAGQLATWSALKFTHPRKGKTYRNSHGKLPEA